ncbi:hypothetical protein [Endozoicomonas euniceicola]|uniref:Uncharacterized protein n=1 Tax=Endozoicomonas euniceicola TaxID=1234143 RepID=A0ABY6GUP0_9GAMM|nr:hypothetical protein [Endozoicomonas euniceicola]UYM16104.1 hypothetical protein NX720_25440 [Endozoicomonas euniceicola]
MPSVTRSFRLLFLLSVSLLLAGNCRSESFSSQAVHASTLFLNARAKELADSLEASYFKVSVESPPKRIKLPLCPDTPEIKLVTLLAPGRQSVKVICRERDNQSLLLHANVSLFLPVLISTGRIQGGSRVTGANSNWEIRDISRLKQGYFRDIDQLKRLQAAKTIKPNQVLTPMMFLPAKEMQKH